MKRPAGGAGQGWMCGRLTRSRAARKPRRPMSIRCRSRPDRGSPRRHPASIRPRRPRAPRW
ncbi:hypothetical protein E4O86_22105 [Rhizobiales bacterium L72]|uniref:Uncharacterized protein n=1 Tax=Propylenella binzhouense TaxID=2555902 RepID=A0A964T9K6_9HYPH|nr:hypothetical protein [Propylenella binzhouense]